MLSATELREQLTSGLDQMSDKDAHEAFSERLDSFLEENGIMSIAYATSNDRLWIGTRSGLAYLSEDKGHIKYLDKMRGSIVYTLTIDESGDVWIGDFNNGLIHMDGQTNEVKNQWQMGSITKIEIDTDGFAWAGTMEGLLRVNKHSGELLNLYSLKIPMTKLFLYSV